MQLCWSEPRLRPSLRELRIMLLHLLSTKGNSDSSAFEQKWNQLMPRRPPVVQRVADGSDAHTGFDTDFMQLDAARLAENAGGVTNGIANGVANSNVSGAQNLSLHDELSQAMTYGTNTPSPTKEMSPTNELSLEAELSLAMGGGDMVSQERGSPEGGRQSDEEEPRSKADIEVTVEDADAEKQPDKQSVPDIVATSTVQTNGKPDFITSTPKPDKEKEKRNSENADDDIFSSTLDSNASFDFNPRVMRTSSGPDYDDGSLFAQSKFAAMLQTVAAPSFDGDADDYDFMSSTSDSVADKSTEDLFEVLENKASTERTDSENIAKQPKQEEAKESEVILLEDTDPLSN